jgi:hypothetical protein
MKMAPLRELAYVVIERHGETARRALDRAMARRGAPASPPPTKPPDQAPRFVGYAYDERDLARQPLKPGNWVTVGEIRAAETTTFIEVNVGTGETREVGEAL